MREYQSRANKVREYQSRANIMRRYQSRANIVREYQSRVKTVREYQRRANIVREYQRRANTVRENQSLRSQSSQISFAVDRIRRDKGFERPLIMALRLEGNKRTARFAYKAHKPWITRSFSSAPGVLECMQHLSNKTTDRKEPLQNRDFRVHAGKRSGTKTRGAPCSSPLWARTWQRRAWHIFR